MCIKLVRAILILFLFLFSIRSFAAIIPSEGALLNHTQVMFEYDAIIGADNYLITITSDPYMVGDERAISFEISNKSLAYLLKSGLHFGRNYKWNYTALKKGNELYKSPEYHFTISSHPFVDPSLYRFHVKSKPGKFADNLIFLDNLGIVIDKMGKPVWFLNDKKIDGASEPAFRNMQLTKDGTITYLDNTNAIEVSLTGDTLWRGPNNGKVSRGESEFYHHEFTKLIDGSYLVGGYFFQNEQGLYNPSIIVNMRYNTIIQYDSDGNVKWSWNEKDHVGREMLYRNSTADATNIEGTHLNGFSIDTTSKAIIASFRNNSSVLKIDIKTGKVIYDWGKHNIVNQKTGDPVWFSRQHGPVVMKNGNILIYNNNVVDDEKSITYPKVLIVQQPGRNADSKKIWEYEIQLPDLPGGHRGKEGYALELSNGNLLVCIGGLNKIFEITLEKEIVWECSFEKYLITENKWIPFTNYRTNTATSLFPRYFTLNASQPFISGSRLNGLILNNEGTEKDAYYIEVSANGKQVGKISVELNGRTSAGLIIPVSTTHSNKISVKVFPKHQPRNVRIYQFDLK